MKKLFLLCCLCCLGLPMLAQKVYFVYIQSESRTPFYAKMGEKVFSSTGTGYLILSKLKDSTYTFQVGPAASEGEQRFDLSIGGKDRGYLLKKFADGWGLFDLQTMAIIKPSAAGTSMINGGRVKEDRFTTMLSQAADDTSLLYQPAVAVTTADKQKKEEKPNLVKETTALPATIAVVESEKPQASAAPEKVVDTSKEQPDIVAGKQPDSNMATAVAEPKTAAAAPEEAGASPAFKRSQITRRSESSTVEGFGLVFLDDADGVVDTIRLVIPNAKAVFTEDKPAEAVESAPIAKTAAPAIACSGQAGEKEFFKLRRNLASIDSEGDMTRAAVDAFRKRCFSVEQIKNLSSLFLTQAGKYNFLVSAYPYVFDREKFGTLQSELFEASYLTRFKALTSN